MTRSRIATGFHRIGLVVAVPCMVLAIAFAGTGFVRSFQKQPAGCGLSFDDLIPQKNDLPPGFVLDQQKPSAPAQDPRCPAGYKMSEAPVSGNANGEYEWAAGIALASLFIYLAAWAIGWILRGFVER